jgi:hypothetical protein
MTAGNYNTQSLANVFTINYILPRLNVDGEDDRGRLSIKRRVRSS